MKVANALLDVMYPPRGKQASQSSRIRAARVRQALKGLWKIDSVVDRYGFILQVFSGLLTSPLRPHNSSFDAIFKAQSFEGYDVVDNYRKVDYGNRAYKTFSCRCNTEA